MDSLAWVSFALTLISFFWIGYRCELPTLQAALAANPDVPGRVYFRFFLPYALAALGLMFLLYTSLSSGPVELHRHNLRSISSLDQTRFLDGRDRVEIESTEEWFSIILKGQIVGPEIEELQGRLGTLNDVRVYAIVEELGNTDGVFWVQQSDWGTLDPQGRYQCRARLGGQGVDSAADGRTFKVRIYIPDRNVVFTPRATYDLGTLPGWVYLSDPYYVTTRRAQAKEK